MIKLCFGRSKGLRSWLIRWSTAGSWSHVWFELELFDRVWALHSGADGVQIVSALKVREGYDEHKWLELDIPVSAVIISSHDFLGAGYDYGVIPNALLLVLRRWTGVVWFDPRRDPSRFSCSELACSILQRIGIPEMRGLTPEFVTPGNLADIYLKEGSDA